MTLATRNSDTRAALGEHPHTQARLILEEWAKLHPAKTKDGANPTETSS
jgi:hypothetical protein